ncbi:hypothetical protein [Herbaspirillum huttiense]|uniref:hypothetical protein n=1 Tax=Herbaspirillum huttiense TaxID=863372 RepID=UPI002E795717|nr:hypothetical protein [Herbaspirillum huttiense]MEE1634870.1 hypothetical protein [Herbaspirillum huttiense NC40101]
MKPSSITLSRIEFHRIHIDVNYDFEPAASAERIFPQLDLSFNGVVFKRYSELMYPEDETADPRHFTFHFGLQLAHDDQDKSVTLPYEIDIGGTVYCHLDVGNIEGAERFRAVRNTAYMMVYGAIREQVATLTGRSVHGSWMLPAPTFASISDEEAQSDELKRQEQLKLLNKPKRGRKKSSTSDVLDVTVSELPKKGPGSSKKRKN